MEEEYSIGQQIYDDQRSEIIVEDGDYIDEKTLKELIDNNGTSTL